MSSRRLVLTAARLLAEYIRINTSNPPGNELATARWLRSVLARAELFHAIERVAGRLLPGIPVATPVSAGASGRPYYASAGLICYGIDPWLVELEESRHSVHGNDERLSLENIEFGLKLYAGVIQEMQR